MSILPNRVSDWWCNTSVFLVFVHIIKIFRASDQTVPHVESLGIYILVLRRIRSMDPKPDVELIEFVNLDCSLRCLCADDGSIVQGGLRRIHRSRE